uniref:phenylalanine--tRNA ligase n=1 Tax=Hirondellea gigas TaxID=1518452 RepID=A0A6A7G8D1_9CRUS
MMRSWWSAGRQFSTHTISQPFTVPKPAFGSKSCNVTERILRNVGKNLHNNPKSPLGIIKLRIEDYFNRRFVDSNGKSEFQMFDSMNPVVSTKMCFDDLLIPIDHPGRNMTDTFYFDEKTLLRTHTSAHETELMRAGNLCFLATGDCYRRDEIDSRHYPVFHQTEAARIFKKSEVPEDFLLPDLKQCLEGLVADIFGDVETRWNPDSFPFTDPSLELEIMYNGSWMELLGCGVLRKDVLKNGNLHDHHGWAFGIGLERVAMALFDIPDIRLFHSSDERFTSQFTEGKIVKFRSFSKFPACYKDISFWVNPSFHENNFSELVRDTAGDLVETVKLVDEFKHPETGQVSKCYRINYRSFSRVLTNDEVDEIQDRVRERIEASPEMDLR